MITPIEPNFHISHTVLDEAVLALWEAVQAGAGLGRLREDMWRRHGELVPLYVKARALAASCTALAHEYAAGKALLAAQSLGETGNFSRPDGKWKEVREGRRLESLYTDPQHWGQQQGEEFYTLRASQCTALAEGIAAELRKLEAQLAHS